MKDTIWETWA